MTIVERMKTDWNRRAQDDARYWIDVDCWASEAAFAAAGRATAARLLDHLGDLVRPDWRALDVGCGIGRVLREIAPVFASIVGVDVSGEMVRQARARLADVGNARVVETTGADLRPIEDASIDFAYSALVVQHVPKPVFVLLLAEINRVIVHGGLFLFQACLGESRAPVFGDTIALEVYHPEEMAELLAMAGFAFVSDRCERQEPDRALGSWWVLVRRVRPAAAVDAGCLSWDVDPRPSPVDAQMIAAREAVRRAS